MTALDDHRVGRGSFPVGKVLGYAALVVAAAALLLPFFWMVSSSLKTSNTVFTNPVTWLPDVPRWRNYLEIWRVSDMLVWLRNTVVLSVVVTFLQLFTGSFAAYGFAKARFPGRNLLFVLYIGTIAVPWQAYMIPQFIFMSEIGLTDTLWSIIALQAFGAFGVFLMRQYYATIPDELCEAARVDGLSEYGIYFRIVLPLSVPALASLALLTLVTTWNDYLGPLIYLRDPDLWTIQLGLKTFVSEYSAEHALIMTGSVLSVLPVAIVFLLGQKYFVQGIATSGMKG
ncbi:carbohydrate ABC transporter permease [Saccharothrix sp. HUAS TT1]|uniref:carbohydrate ABC transporter permease n=1 Tax=unclassified Saccharothrix TaxID=2593673 RepID=UPI00345B5D2C